MRFCVSQTPKQPSISSAPTRGMMPRPTRSCSAPVFSARLQLELALGTFGLTALDRFLSCKIVKKLQTFQQFYTRQLMENKPIRQLLFDLEKAIEPIAVFPEHPKVYDAIMSKLPKQWALISEFITEVGQLQLIRRLIANELRTACEFDSKMLFGALSSFNETIISDVEAHYADPTLPYPGGDEGKLFVSTTEFSETAGLHDPMGKIYVITQKSDKIALVMFLFTLTQLARLKYEKNVSSFITRKQDDGIDGVPVVNGLVTLMKQYHPTHMHQYLGFLSQYIRSSIGRPEDRPKVGLVLSAEAMQALAFLDELAAYSKIERTVIQSYIPSYVFDEYRRNL
eukprot:m.790919 g.790919  ORF g.790919 m.790919 type:complete len:340 (-) comp59208_c1_seq1:436-1455(-)